MNRNKLYWIVLIVLIGTGCYKDKGNYDYVSVNEIEISGIDERQPYYLWLGENFTMPVPEIVFKDSTKAHSDLSYRWRLNKEVISTEKVLDVLVKLKPNTFQGWGDFTVKDERTGISYLKKFRVSIMAPFDMGWVWLTENEGHTELNMYPFSGKNALQNVYANINGMNLPLETWGLTEHFSQTGSGWQYGFLVVGENAVEINKSDLTNEAWVKEEFVGGRCPADLKIATCGFIKNYSCIVTQDGQLYVRYAPGGYLYEGRYPSVPCRGDYKLLPLSVNNMPPAYNILIFYDELQERYMYLYKGELRGFDRLEDAGAQFRVTGMGKAPVFMKSVAQQENTSTFYAILKDKAGRYYEQIFEFTLAGDQAALKTVSENPFPMALTENTCFTIQYKQKNLYIGQGKQLYNYEIGSGNPPQVYDLDFGEGDIVALEKFFWTGDLGVMVQKSDKHDFYWLTEEHTVNKTVTDIPGKVKTLVFKVGPYASFYSYY